jgi:ATP-dependent HslUV protease ATP-binding subunit HslU
MTMLSGSTGIAELTPRQIVAELDKYIVGQHNAKRAVAIALRNRYRREKLPDELQREIIPKNILMIGPTGVGKTEIARRLASLAGAPFVKVEATKYTEVGYVGRDVESMVRDLAEASIRMVRDERRAEVKEAAEAAAVERIIDVLHPETRPPQPQQNNPFATTLGSIFGNSFGGQQAGAQTPPAAPNVQQAPPHEAQRIRDEARADIERGFYDVRLIEIEVEEAQQLPIGVLGGNDPSGGMNGGGGDMSEMLAGLMPKKRAKKRVTVAEARRIFAQEEEGKLIDMDAVKREALRRAGERGIIFIDEIDKIATREGRGVDVSREGVQRDILPIVEGSTVNTKYGALATDHVLFIAAGAFHMSKPSDLIPELQGRFPIRVELDSLTAGDFETILTQPKNALLTQYSALLAADGVTLDIRPDAIAAIARIATEVNERSENIGARRLHTVLERLFEEIGYAAPETAPAVTIDAPYVVERLGEIAANADLSNFIL